METKTCTKCGTELPATEENFRKTTRGKYGFRGECKQCERIYNRRHKKKRYKKLCEEPGFRESENERMREFFKNNPKYREKHNKYMRDKYANNNEYREKCLKYHRDRRKNDTEFRNRIDECGKKWRQNNKNKHCAKEARRRSMKLEQTPIDADQIKIENLYLWAEIFGLITGRKYHVDHIYPLQGKKVSGLHMHENLQILEARSNLEKSNKMDTDIVGFSYDTLRAMYRRK